LIAHNLNYLNVAFDFSRQHLAIMVIWAWPLELPRPGSWLIAIPWLMTVALASCVCIYLLLWSHTQMNHMENCAIIANKNVYERYLLTDANDDSARPAGDMNHHKSKSGINIYRNFIIISSRSRPRPAEKGRLCVNWRSPPRENCTHIEIVK